MTVCECVSARVKELLEERQMTQYRLEKKSGIQHGAMNRIMRCENKGMEISTAAMLARGFDLTLVEFLSSDLFDADNMEIE